MRTALAQRVNDAADNAILVHDAGAGNRGVEFEGELAVQSEGSLGSTAIPSGTMTAVEIDGTLPRSSSLEDVDGEAITLLGFDDEHLGAEVIRVPAP